MRWMRLHWLDDLVLPALVITMRTAWIWPWLVVSAGWLAPFTLQPVVPLWGVVVFQVIGRSTVRMGAVRKWSLPKARLVVAGTGVALVVGLVWLLYGRQLAPIWNPFWMADLVTQIGTGIPGQAAALLTFVVAAGLYFRGVLDGRELIGHDEIWAGFFWGVLAFCFVVRDGEVGFCRRTAEHRQLAGGVRGEWHGGSGAVKH
ncbi:MAG: hypothetical protein IPK16_15750 [Anaerolineales bacterium]|nr:hypothetical protein [Anaerolineales bacterium]